MGSGRRSPDVLVGCGTFDAASRDRLHATVEERTSDVLRLQKRGAYPVAFQTITVPVLRLHGSFDPHPGRSTEAILRPHLPQLEYREWEHCGHYPWLERAVHEDLVTTLRAWLVRCS